MSITEQEIAREIERFEGGIDLMEKVAGDMTSDQLHARPVPGKMSMLECVCHMADFEPILVYRMKCMLAFHKPELIGIDEDAYGKGLRYEQRDLREELDVFATTRRQMLRLLRTLGPDDFERRGVHSELGEITFMSYLKGASGHVNHHMKHMNDKRIALGLTAIPCEESRDYPAKAAD